MNSYVDSNIKIRDFHERMWMAGHRIVPQVYLKPTEGKEGNVRHLIHDCKGVVIPSNEPDRIRGVVDPSTLETLRNAVREDYVQKAKIVWTSKTSETIKN